MSEEKNLPRKITCDDPNKFFHDCKDCDHYEKCDYFQKVKRRVKKKPSKIQKDAILLDTDTGKTHKWNGKKWIQVYP